jgi:hypothetical protein
MTKKVDLYEDGLEEYPLSQAVLGNILMIAWFVLGTIIIWFVHWLLAVLYFIFAFAMVYVVLKKIVCTNCYYYGKRCSLAWGKLSALLFKEGRLDLFQNSIGLKIAPPTYGILMIIPLILGAFSLYHDGTLIKALLFLAFLMIAMYSAGAGRKKSCANCKMRKICPGSAVK